MQQPGAIPLAFDIGRHAALLGSKKSEQGGREHREIQGRRKRLSKSLDELHRGHVAGLVQEV